MSPRISVIIPAFNAAQSIGLQLEALSRQVDAPAFDVLIVDNGSTDHLHAVVDEWMGALSLRVVVAPERQGVSYARNAGIAHVSAERFAICDADDVVSQFWLRDMWKALQNHEVVSGNAIPTPSIEFSSVEHIWSLIDVDNSYLEPVVHPAPESYPIMMGGNCAMSTAIARELGGFDQSFVRGSDDNDFSFRLVKAGYQIAHSDSARLAYRDPPHSKGMFKKSYYRAFMHTRLAERHGVWRSSPNLRRGWALEAPRGIVAAGLMAAGLKRKDWPGAASRIGMGFGLLVGFLVHRVLRRDPGPELAVGLEKESDA